MGTGVDLGSCTSEYSSGLEDRELAKDIPWPGMVATELAPAVS